MSGGVRLGGPKALRLWWEERIPTDVVSMYISDAHKLVRAVKGAPIISRRTLQRHAEAGTLRAIGGSGTPSHPYQLTRDALLDYLAALDGLWIDGDQRLQGGRRERPPKKPRKNAAKRKRDRERERELREEREWRARRKRAKAAREEKRKAAEADLGNQLTLWDVQR